MIRYALRDRGYLPILFDFEKPASRNLTETISTLAHLSRFIVADITDARSIPQELQRIIPHLPAVPVKPLIHVAESEYGMFEDFRDYPWVLTTSRYDDADTLIATFKSDVITPCEARIQNKVADALRGSRR